LAAASPSTRTRSVNEYPYRDYIALAHGRLWHEPVDPRCLLTGRYRVISGRHMLNASSSHFDPEST
jgi:hypothetical protein